MESAFGVDHGISKSFVNGKFIPAAELSTKQAAKVARGGQWKKARGATKADTAFKNMMSTPEVKATLPTMNGVTVNRDLPKHIGGAGTVRIGSKSSGRSYVGGQAGSAKVARQLEGHEAVHANTKRSSYRLHSQIMGSPKKLFREEARADWHGQGHYADKNAKNGVYAGMARAEKAISQGRGSKPARMNPIDRKQYKQAGMPAASNKFYLKSMAATIDQNTPQYRLSEGSRGRKAARSYRKLQDDFQRRGVPRRNA